MKDVLVSLRSLRRPQRIGLLGANLEAENLGVGALAVGAIRCLLASFPNADIRLLDYAKEPSIQTLRLDDEELRIPVVNMRFSKRIFLSNNIALLLGLATLWRFFPFERFRKWLVSQNQCLREILGMDFVASIAGGDSFSDIYGFERLIYISLPQILILLLKKPLILLPQTIGPFKSTFARKLARYILVRADRIYSRDSRGLDELNTLAQARKVMFCYDLGFLLNPRAPSALHLVGLTSLQQPRPLVALNISGLLLMGGYDHKNLFGLRINYRQLIDDIIHLLIQDEDMYVLLVPHVFSSAPESDVTACEEVFKNLSETYRGRLGLLRGEYDQHQIKAIIGQCDFLIGARMHACIAAISQAIPALCIAYSDKFIGVMETLGIEDVVIDARQFDEAEMIQAIGRCIVRREEIRRLLRSKIPNVQASIMHLLSSGSATQTSTADLDCVTR